MRTVSADTTAAWISSYKGGVNRPMVRATIQELDVTFINYDRSKLKGATPTTKGTGKFASLMFGQRHRPQELPNIKAVSWSRSVDQDTAECTITLWNTSPLPLGATPDPGFESDFDRPGWYTWDRDAPAANARWGTTKNKWQGLLIPDRVIRTYEGYGFNSSVAPELDENLYQSGCWIIDDVDFTHDGFITVRCRDYARVLLDHIMFPPVVPWADYPLVWDKYHAVPNKPKIKKLSGGKWFRPAYQTDSNIPYIGRGFTDGSRPYVDGNGAVLGHHGRHALDKSTDTYWMSVGNMASWSSAFEFVQGSFSKRSVAAVKIKTWGGPYTCYVSVKVGGKWQGGRTIPYGARVVDTDADIRYVKRVRVDKNDWTEIPLPKAYANATAVRVTFTDLYNSGIGYFKFRAGLRDFQVLQQTSATKETPNGTHVEGNYGDYSDIVLWLLAWSGFFWPDAATKKNFYTYSNGTRVHVNSVGQRYPDPLPEGRLWGDWMPTGTYGISLPATTWDKKPVMDGIRFIKDIVGFNFWVDETGGAVWRLPNIFTTGNYLSGADGGQYASRTSTAVVIDEKVTLQSLRAVLSSKNVRETVFIASASGKFGAISKGYDPTKGSGLRRVGGWTDQNFTNEEECQVMADMITLRQMFSYRKDTVVIPGYPAIQIDDQVRIYERTTAETYLHYVSGISSEIDLVTGKWNYTLTTHWLGDNPDGTWALNNQRFAEATKKYLKKLGVA